MIFMKCVLCKAVLVISCGALLSVYVYYCWILCAVLHWVKPLNAELNPIRHLLALVGARHIVHVSRIRLRQYRKV